MKIDAVYKKKKFLVQISNNRHFLSKNKKNEILKVSDKSLSKEFELAKQLDSKYIKVIKFQNFEDGSTIEMPYYKEVLLSKFIKKDGVDLINFFKIGNQLIDLLENIHKHRMILGALNPDMVLINPDTQNIRLLEWSYVTPFERTFQIQPDVEYLYKYASYIAPEQTGRLEKPIDHRTDFYCFGILLYQMLTGKPPFEADTSFETIYRQISAIPDSPKSFIQDLKAEQIPDVVCQIILKLLSKDPEERYQSIKGLKKDFNKAETIWKCGSKEVFILGTEDISPFFHIPEKVYGREDEKKILEEVYKQACENKVQLLLVSGYSGIGKTALIRELQHSALIKKGFFISGKYDLLRRSTAYSAIIEALDQLCRMLLSEPTENLNKWKEKILEILGQSGRILTEIIPKLELIIGLQPELPEMDLQARQNLFNITLIRFISLFTLEEYSLVMFLDDLQWVDIPSLNILNSILTFHPDQKFMTIGAYRSNEVDAAHPLSNFIKNVEKEKIPTARIELGPLKAQYIKELCSETFKKPVKEVIELTKVLEEKTGGNPFFLKAFLKNMYDTGLITFSEETGWQWSIKEILAQEVTENVAVLVSSIINRFEDKTRELIIEGSFLGNIFKIIDLRVIFGLDEIEIQDSIQPAVLAGILLPQDSSYKFAHDKFQEAAYSLVEEPERLKKHLNIARMLYSEFELSIEERLFDIVQQYNRAIGLITDKAELLLIVRLNFRGAVKVKDSQAYNIALQYLEVIITVFSEGKIDLNSLWQNEYNFMYEFYKEYAELLYLNQQYEKSEEIITDTIPYTQNILDKCELKRILIAQYMIRVKYRDALNRGIEILNELGVNFPLNNYANAFQAEFEWNKAYMSDRSISSILDLPEIIEPKIVIAVKIFNDIIMVSYVTDIDIWKFTVVKAVNISLQYGVIPEASISFAWFGIVLNYLYQKYDEGYKYSQIALELSFKSGNLSQIGRNLHMETFYTSVWVKHLSYAMNNLEKSINYSYQAGNLEWMGYTRGGYYILSFIAGIPLEKILEKSSEILDFFLKTKHIDAWNFALSSIIIEWNLSGRTFNRYTFNYNEIDEVSFIKLLKKAQNYIQLAYYMTLKSQTLYYYENFKEALKANRKSEALFPLLRGYSVEFEFVFYQALILIALYLSRNLKTRAKYKKKIEQNLKQFEIWNRYCPDNFGHRYLLLKAEYENKILGNQNVTEYYETAIKSAKRAGFLQIEALANELYAKYWLVRGNKEFAQMCFFKARDLYNEWGAKRKVECLEEFYEDIFTMEAAFPAKLVAPAILIDYEAVMNTTYAITEELNLDSLIKKMISILGRQSGAQYSVMVLFEKENTYKTAVFCTSENKTALKSINSKDICFYMPDLLFNYIQRSGEYVIIDDLNEENTYSKDSYFLKHKPKSVLGLPIKKGDEIYGVLYFENHYVIKGFSESRVELLKTLLVQCAISIQNARSQERLVRKVEQETILRKITEAIRSSLDINEILDIICNKLAKIFDVDRVTITTFPNPDDFSEYEIKREYKSSILIKSVESLPDVKLLAKLWAETLFLGGGYIIVDNVAESKQSDFFKQSYEMLGVKAIMGFPIKKEDKWGMLTVSDYKNSRKWTEDEINFFETITDQVYIAINQADLYEHTRQKAREETILREVISDIKPSQNLEQVYNYLVKKIAETFNASRVAFIEMPFFENDKDPKIMYQFTKRFQKPLEIQNLPKKWSNIFKKAADLQEMLIINNVKDYYPQNRDIQEFFEEYSIKSLASVPLIRYNHDVKILGIFTICFSYKKTLNEYEIDLMNQIAKSVVNVIWDIHNIIEINQIKDTFSMALAHDLQVPLIGINKTMEYILTRQPDIPIGKFHDLLELTVEENTKTISHLQILLEIYSYETGKKSLKLQETELKYSIEKVTENLESKYRKKKLTVNIIIPNEELSAYIDIIEIETVLNIIIENAMKYIQKKGIINIEAIQAFGQIIIKLEDNGPGISEEIQKMLFQRYKMTKALERRIGAGLNLYLAKLIIEAHGGKIWFESKEGVGTTFYFTLSVG